MNTQQVSDAQQEEIVKGQLSKHHRCSGYLTAAPNYQLNNIPTNQVTLTELNIALYEEHTGRVLGREGDEVYRDSVNIVRKWFESSVTAVAFTEKQFMMSPQEIYTDVNGHKYFVLSRYWWRRMRSRFTWQQRSVCDVMYRRCIYDNRVAFYTENLDSYADNVADTIPVTTSDTSTTNNN